MKGQSHLGLLLEMNIHLELSSACLNIPGFGESHENVWVWMGWVGAADCLGALPSEVSCDWVLLHFCKTLRVRKVEGNFFPFVLQIEEKVRKIHQE